MQEEASFLECLATLDETDAEEYVEFLSSLTISVNLEECQSAAQDPDLMQHLGLVQGRYAKIGELGNGSAISRQLPNPHYPGDSNKITMVYFNGKDSDTDKAIT